MDEDGDGVVSSPFLNASIFFLTLPLFFSKRPPSMGLVLARRLVDLPGLASGLRTHHEDFPVPSFWTRMNRLCRDRLWRMEFFQPADELESPLSLK